MRTSLIADALYNLAEKWATNEYKKGIAVGVMAAIQAYNKSDWDKALPIFLDNLPTGFSYEQLEPGLPIPWRPAIREAMRQRDPKLVH